MLTIQGSSKDTLENQAGPDPMPRARWLPETLSTPGPPGPSHLSCDLHLPRGHREGKDGETSFPTQGPLGLSSLPPSGPSLPILAHHSLSISPAISVPTALGTAGG